MAKENKLKGGSRTHCAAINCTQSKRTRPDLSFFRFPKDMERSKEWVNNCRREDLLGKSAEYLYKNCKLCADHFEDCMFTSMEKKRLNPQSKPTLFKIPNPPPQIGKKRRAIERKEIQYVPSEENQTIEGNQVYDIQTNQSNENEEDNPPECSKRDFGGQTYQSLR
ncbi:52 kDa repressor of the inhibitor of the protein kinase-like isoform X2 [Xenia sp. Carnegie-2017]|uniref:52 kDa repressor of the inhibitor of the protein kinase-like isoform X2 n=1 Tax=Xenia sp. Carnegie-2017 TaxID=2897299 RepID=UPI001F04BA4A|nr:52 kDa repressor of the inhibitor of the protein kinase-like isoform X2 [Xenia sp. Carnegie-2017]